MNQREPIDVLRGLCWRASMASVLLGLLMVPGLIAVRFGGLDGAVKALGLGIVLAGWFTWRSFKRQGITLREYLAAPGPGASHAPVVLFVVGCVLATGGVATVATAADPPQPAPGRMSAAQQRWGGAALLLWGVGLCGLAASHGLGRLALTRTIGRLTEELQFRPDDAQLHFRRAMALAQRGKLRPAVDDFSEVVRLDPQNVEVRLERGDLYYRLHDPEQAAADYAAAIELDPENVEAYAKRGYIHQQLGRDEEADADFAMAEKVTNQSTEETQ